MLEEWRGHSWVEAGWGTANSKTSVEVCVDMRLPLCLAAWVAWRRLLEFDFSLQYPLGPQARKPKAARLHKVPKLTRSLRQAPSLRRARRTSSCCTVGIAANVACCNFMWFLWQIHCALVHQLEMLLFLPFSSCFQKHTAVR